MCEVFQKYKEGKKEGKEGGRERKREGGRKEGRAIERKKGDQILLVCQIKTEKAHRKT